MQLSRELLPALRVALVLALEEEVGREVWRSFAEELWLKRQHRRNLKSMDPCVPQSDRRRLPQMRIIKYARMHEGKECAGLSKGV
jgi:hypothetical protein